MDAYQQQTNRYMRPPPLQPPPTMDPHQLYPEPPRPPTLQGSWYSNQFQYQHHQSHSSPSPPPPLQVPSQWGPPPHSEHSTYTLHPRLPYPGNQFPPPHTRPHLLPPQIPRSYPQVNQEWSNPNWSYHHGWDYSAHNNIEDWGAKAREWANARTAMQGQQPQSQFTPMGRPEDQNCFHDQYQQAVDTHYQDTQPQSLSTSNYQQFPGPAALPHGPPMMYPQESLPGSSAPSYNIAYGHETFQVKNGTSASNSNAGFQESLPTASSIHQQEVPSSYSSVSENEDSADQKQLYNPSVSAVHESQQQLQPSVPAAGRSGTIEQSFTYGSQAVYPIADLSDQPLDFTARFNELDPHMHSSFTAHGESAGAVRGIEPVTAVPSINAWAPPLAPPAVYPTIPPVLPSGVQHNSSMAVPSPLSRHAAPPFGRFPGPSFEPNVPTAGAPFVLGTGAPLHPTSAFPRDTRGSVSESERPKKAPVPSWLKEEIIKNKAAIAKSSLEHPKEETQSIEVEGVDKSFGNGDQADSKSIDSSTSTEEEYDDEDYVEVARTAAINQEIKRVLTEVLLKVTDELFDEIATKVLSEDDLTVEVTAVDHKNLSSRSSAPAVAPAKASAMVVLLGKGKESDCVGLSKKSSSSSAGDVLGLANYASDDDDDDDETESSRVPETRNNAVLQTSRVRKVSESMLDSAENGYSHVESDKHYRSEKNLESDLARIKDIKDVSVAGLSGNGPDRVHDFSYSSKVVSESDFNASSEKQLDGNNGSWLNDTSGEKVMTTSELPEKSMGKKSKKDDSQGREPGLKSDKDTQRDDRKSSGKGSAREVEISRTRKDEKGDENCQRQDKRHLRKEKTDDQNGLKEPGVKTEKKGKESESQRQSNHFDAKDKKKDSEKSHSASVKEEVDRKREHAKEEDRSRQKLGSDSSRHKRRRSFSPSSRGRSIKDNSGSHSNDTSDETSDDSKRKSHSRRRNLSPSPVRRRRQVSRSPHSKLSQRRHSAYSSLGTTSTRGRRSRSRSPVHRQR